MEILFLIIGLVVGFLVGYLLMKSAAVKLNAQLDAAQAGFDKNVAQLKDSHAQVLADKERQIGTLTQKINMMDDEIRSLTSAKTQAETKMEALNEKLTEQTANMEKQFQQMKEQFRNIATSVIRDNSTDISKMSIDSLRTIVDPLTVRINEFREKVDKCYVDEAKERFSLQEEIKRLVEANQRIGEDANNLATALKGNSKVQGDWGEMILDDILSKSGLTEGIHYHKQEYTRDEQGRIISNDEGGKMRTDVIVDFPGDRKMIIDSKVSLTAYSNYVNADSREQAEKYAKEHLRSVVEHIDELSRVDYSKYISEAPDFVMMFIPNEPAYSLAIQTNPNLWNYAYDHKVVLMNPTNLISALRLSLDLWRRDDQIKNLDKIVQTATTLYDKVSLFQESMEKIGGGLAAVSKTYDEAMTRFSEGKGNVLTTTQKLMKFGISPKKKLLVKDEEEES